MFGLGNLVSGAIGVFVETPIAMVKDVVTSLEDGGKSIDNSYTAKALDRAGEDLGKVFK